MSEAQLLEPGVNIKPIVSLSEVKVFATNIYGLHCENVIELNGYDDKNFKLQVCESNVDNPYIKTVCQDGYVLKIMNSLDSKNLAVVEAQNKLMSFLVDNGVSCPKLVKTKGGEAYSVGSCSSGEHVIRLLEFIPGTILCDVPRDQLPGDLYYQLGKSIAHLDMVLKNFSHPAYEGHSTVWVLDSIPQLKQFVFAVEDEHRRKMVNTIIEEFENHVISVRKHFEAGMIHGDFNEQNIVLQETENGKWSMKAVLDFGDSHLSCFLYEIAITMAYMVILSKDITIGGHVLAGYSSIRSIPDEEFSLLKICVCARICQSLVYGAYTHMLNPENKYVLSTSNSGWEVLTKLWNEPDEVLITKWKEIMKTYTTFS